MEWTWKGLKSRENKLTPSTSVRGDLHKKTFSGLVGLDHFIREERKGIERNGNTNKERKWKEVETKLDRKLIEKELDRNTRNRKKEMDLKWNGHGTHMQRSERNMERDGKI